MFMDFIELYIRYNEIFFMIDTCQAASMYEKFYSPNILAVASSLVGEDSLSVCVTALFHVAIIMCTLNATATNSYKI